MLLDPISFFKGLTLNFAIYGSGYGFNLHAFIFYAISFVSLPLGYAGVFLIPLAFFWFIKNQSAKILFASMLPLVILFITLSFGSKVYSRNLNAYIGMIFVVSGIYLAEVLRKKNLLRNTLLVIAISILSVQSLYFIKQNLRTDARLLAFEKVSSRWPLGSVVGINGSCTRSHVLSGKYKLSPDPYLSSSLNYYFVDMYWAGNLFYDEYAKSPWFLEFNPIYNTFYHYQPALRFPRDGFRFTPRAIDHKVPDDYDFEVVSGYGPDIVILEKKRSRANP
jgi:hypothetical protein